MDRKWMDGWIYIKAIWKPGLFSLQSNVSLQLALKNLHFACTSCFIICATSNVCREKSANHMAGGVNVMVNMI